MRAFAIGGVVLGHWLVTAIVLGADGALRTASPLDAVPLLRPASWLFQTLGLFFLAAGFAATKAHARRAAARAAAGDRRTVTGTETTRAAARGGRTAGRGGFVARLRTLAAPLVALLSSLAAALTVAVFAGVPGPTLKTVATLVVSPLWFLLPYLVLCAATPLILRLGTVPLVAGGVAVVAAADLGFGVVPLTLCAAWLVPFALGVALARGRLRSPAAGAALLAIGAGAVVALILFAGYPDSAVGVPGDTRSNLNPPSLACVALAVAQTGAAVLGLPWLRRRPRSRTVAAVNRFALPIYLWHQVGLVVATVAVLWLTDGRPVPGLHTAPDGGWLAVRVMWVGVSATLLLAVARRVYDLRRPQFPARPTEVIAVRDSDPPSRSRVAAHSG